MGQSVLEFSVADDGATTAPLVLGHRNGPLAGEVIQLTRPKCYLGAGRLGTSDASRTNLAGVHCLILRGPQHTVVRRWSPSARLNGRPFDDAALKTGDRLQLGAIELEVLADASEETLAEWRLLLSDRVDGRREAREPANPSREAELARRAAGLERNEFELQQKSEQTLQLAEELQRRQVLLDSLAGEVCARENEVKRREAANSQLRIELDAQAEALDCINQRLNEKRAATEIDQAKLSDVLRDRTHAWEVQQAAEAAILAARERAIAQTEARLAERDTQAAATPQSEAPQSDLDQERQFIERDRLQVEQTRAELEQAQADRAQQCDALEKQRVQFETEVRQFEEHRSAFEEAQRLTAHAQAESSATSNEARSQADASATADLERRRCELAELQQQLGDRENQFEGRLAAYSAERVEFAALQEQCDVLHRQLQEQQQQLAERDSEFEQRRQGIEQQHAEQQLRLESIAAKEHHLTERAAELDAIATRQAELLESQRDELARSQANFATESSSRQLELDTTQARTEDVQRQHVQVTEEIERSRAEIASRQAAMDEQRDELATQVNEIAERERLLAEREQVLAERQSMADPLPTAASTEMEMLDVDSTPPESTEEVFRRLGVLSLLHEAPEETVPEDSDQLALAETPVDQQEEEAAPSTDPVDLDEGDESQIIERYMSQLLSRVRGGKADATAAATFVKPVKKPNPAPAESPPARADQAVITKSCERPDTTQQEPPAPAASRHARPSSIEISAMRDLANQSAQAAIDTHTRGILLNDLYVKSIICLTAIVAGIVLLSWVPQIGWIGLLAGATCFVGSGVWGIKLGLLFREFLKASGVAGLDDGDADTDTTVIASAHHHSTEPSDKAN